ncbi:MAG TPA: sugar phosphate isomerase/epimerase family protein [Armatimonadota bacterium]|nr:sugar phosphate isomerase/epimerase family protein [Armatimonadota bacterium]
MSNKHWSRRELMGAAGLAVTGGALGPAPEAAAQAASATGDPPFKLGTVTYNVPKDWDLPTLATLLPKAGITGVELRTTHAHGVEPSLSPAQRAEARQRCADAGLTLWGLGTVCEFHSPDPATVVRNVATCAEFVKLARDVGARGVKVRPNGLPAEVPVEKTLEQIGKALRECGSVAADHGVEIWVEVHGAGTQEPPHMRAIMDHCGHKSVGVNWNSNPTDVRDGSVREAFELLKPFLMSCHINNLWGPYPYRELFALLRGAGYTRYTLCEVGTPVKPEDGVLFFQCYKGLWRELART